MRSEQTMLDLIVATARQDDRVRAVIMNGSRANPFAKRDIFQDFDIVYIVTDINAFKSDHEWIKKFGELMIMQMPDSMIEASPTDRDRFAFLMQFMDGNRIDLTLYPVEKIAQLPRDSLSVLLLNKDNVIEPFEPASDRDYLPTHPTAKAFADCCNEFWWVCPYVAKGLWREQIIYAKGMFERVLRAELLKMLTWHVGVKTDFLRNQGYLGKHLEEFLDPELWSILEKTYSDASYENTWDALMEMCDLFRLASKEVAGHFGFALPQDDDERVSSHLRHVRQLPKDAETTY